MKRNKKITKQDVQDILFLSPMQEGMLFHYLKKPDSRQYVEQISINFTGQIDFPSFESAWRKIVQNHEMLRTVFAWKGLKNPVQIVLKQFETLITESDMTDVENQMMQKAQLQELKQLELSTNFDLEQEPPLRIVLCRLSKDTYEMILTYHHIIFDGWSTGIILKDFCASLGLRTGGITNPGLKTSFKDFLKWYQHQDQRRPVQFWKGYLHGFEEKTLLPADYRKDGEIARVDNYHVTLSDELSLAINQLTREREVTIAA